MSTFRRALPQFIAVGVKNLVLFGNYLWFFHFPDLLFVHDSICDLKALETKINRFVGNITGYGMTLGFPTIFIPAVQGGDGRENGDENDLILTKEQISWLSK